MTEIRRNDCQNISVPQKIKSCVVTEVHQISLWAFCFEPPYIRDVTSLNSNTTTFELWTFSTDSKFDNVVCTLLWNANLWKKILVLRLPSYAQRARERRQTCFFSQFQPITQTTVMECATWFLLSDILHCTNINTEFINFRLLQSFIWPKPLHYVPTDKIIASICIHIRQIWKVEICIQQMRILTSFGTSLPYIQPRHKCCDNVQIWQISAVCYFLQRFKQVISRQICSV